MAVVVSKLKAGTLTVGGVSFACQATNVRLVPPEQPGADKAEETLCGDPLPDEGDTGSVWSLRITAVQDFTDADGFSAYTWTHQGEELPYTWAPVGADGPSYAGTVTVWPVEIGGDVNRRLTADAEWRCTDKPTRTEAAA
jgi:hypothetical protein